MNIGHGVSASPSEFAEASWKARMRDAARMEARRILIEKIFTTIFHPRQRRKSFTTYLRVSTNIV
ncbi:MAG: hypothetical protein QXY41_01175 [Thermoproteota archaeon]